MVVVVVMMMVVIVMVMYDLGFKDLRYDTSCCSGHLQVSIFRDVSPWLR